MDYPRLLVLLSVARHANFSRAARELHLSQPAVSRHIQVLEGELGVLLFQRLGNRVELTDAGQIIVDYAQRVIVLTEDVKRVLGEMEGLQRGRLRVGASSTPGLYLLPEALARFQKKYPGIDVSLTITNSANITLQLLAGEIDLGFTGVRADETRLDVRPFADDEIVLCVPPGHAFNKVHKFSPQMFSEETLIVREPGSGTRQVIETHLSQLGISPKRTLEMSGSEGVKRAVAAGLGVAFISKVAIELELAQGRLSVIEVSDLKFVRKLFVTTRKDTRPLASMLAFLGLLMESDGKQYSISDKLPETPY